MIRSLNINWMCFKSNQICFYCLWWASENTLSCRHTVCNICVWNIEDETLVFNDQYQIDVCLLCCTKKLVIKLRSFTAELQVLSINSGETRRVIAIEIMNLLQSILRDVWRIQNLFDVAYSISVDKSHNFDDLLLHWCRIKRAYCVNSVLVSAVCVWVHENVQYSDHAAVLSTVSSDEQFQSSL